MLIDRLREERWDREGYDGTRRCIVVWSVKEGKRLTGVANADGVGTQDGQSLV